MGHQNQFIDLRCPQCVAQGRKGLLAKLSRQQWNAAALAAFTSGEPQTIVELSHYCGKCETFVVFSLVVLNVVSTLTGVAEQ